MHKIGHKGIKEKVKICSSEERLPFLNLNKLASMLLETGENIKKLKHYSLYQINLNAYKSDIDINKKVIPFDIENNKIYPITTKIILSNLSNTPP